MKQWITGCLLLLLTSCKMSCFAPKAETIESPIASSLQAASGEGQFDHSSYDQLLRANVDYAAGRVDYASLKKEQNELLAYNERLGDAELSKLSSEARMALLINAYNAFTLQLILENYPGVSSIKDLDSPWKAERWELGGDTVSLDDIEHGLLRPVFKDPRIHFAVNCAAIGCPALADFAFRSESLDEQLEEVSRRTLRSPRYARAEGGELRLTKILSWYGDDFTKEGWSPRAESIPEFVARYGSDAVRELVEKHGADTPVAFVDYDWSLNDIERE